MKLTGRIFLFFLFSVLIVSCTNPPTELQKAEQLIENKPDLALLLLKNLSPTKYKYDESKALYGLLMTEALDRLKLPLKPDSLLDFSLNYYEKHPDPVRLANCYLYKGRKYKYNFQNDKAISYYMKAMDELKNSTDATIMGRINFDLGDILNLQGEFKSARDKYQLAYHYFNVQGLQTQAFYALLNIGRTYHAAREYKKARLFYAQIHCKAKDSILQGALYQEIGLNFYSSHQPDSAEKYLKKVLNYPYISNNRAIRYYLLASLCFDNGRIDSAFMLASQSFRYNPDIRQREWYRIMANCKFAHGVVKQVPYYMSNYVRLGDSLRKIDAQPKANYI